MPQTAALSATPTASDEAEPFEPIWFNNARSRGVQYLVPDTGWLGTNRDGTDKFDPAQAQWLKFVDGRYLARTPEEAAFLRRSSGVHEGTPGYNKPCRTCGRVWQSEDARDDCASLHAR